MCMYNVHVGDIIIFGSGMKYRGSSGVVFRQGVLLLLYTLAITEEHSIMYQLCCRSLLHVRGQVKRSHTLDQY